MKRCRNLSHFIFLLCVCTCVSEQLFPQTCNPNGTVQVQNPDPSLYVSVFAVQNEGYSNAVICNATMDGSAITVTGCDIGIEITVFLSDRVMTDGMTFVGDGWTAYCVFCERLLDSGVTRTVTGRLEAELLVTTQEAITPSFTISSALRLTSPSGAVVTSARVGDTIYWTIDYPSDYNARPSCTAFSGTDRTGSPSKQLFVDGCSEDADLLTGNFENVLGDALPGVNRLYVQIYAFRFYNNDDVYFECSVKLCPQNSVYCDLSCDNRRRRGSRDGYAHGVEGGSVYTANSQLHIIPDAESSASFTLGSLWILALSLLLAR